MKENPYTNSLYRGFVYINFNLNRAFSSELNREVFYMTDFSRVGVPK